MGDVRFGSPVVAVGVAPATQAGRRSPPKRENPHRASRCGFRCRCRVRPRGFEPLASASGGLVPGSTCTETRGSTPIRGCLRRPVGGLRRVSVLPGMLLEGGGTEQMTVPGKGPSPHLRRSLGPSRHSTSSGLIRWWCNAPLRPIPQSSPTRLDPAPGCRGGGELRHLAGLPSAASCRDVPLSGDRAPPEDLPGPGRGGRDPTDSGVDQTGAPAVEIRSPRPPPTPVFVATNRPAGLGRSLHPAGSFSPHQGQRWGPIFR